MAHFTSDTSSFAGLRGRVATGGRLRGRLRDYLALMAQRRALGGLDADRLADLGLTQAQAQAEAARPVWDVPHWWR